MLHPTHAKYKTIYCIRWSLGGSTRVLYRTSVRIVGSFVWSIVCIVASVRMQIPKSPLARGVKCWMIMLGPSWPLLWAITAGVSLCDSLELHYAVTLWRTWFGRGPYHRFKIFLRCVAKRHDYMFRSMCSGTSCSTKCHLWDMTSYLPARQTQKSPSFVG